MPHPLLKFYGRIEGEFKQGLKRQGLTPSCQRGCAHCCYILTAIHAVEGQILAQAVMRKQNWKDIAQKCRADALRLDELFADRMAYFDAYIPCPLLNVETRECTVYESRPACCRFYYVVSSPLLCAPANHVPNLRCINTSEIEALAMKACVELAGGAMIFAPISLMLLFSLPKAAKVPEDEAFLRGLAEGLPDPVTWMVQNNERREQWLKEEGDEVGEVYRKSISKVFGI